MTVDILASDLATDAHQYLTFIMGEEVYGLDVLKVQEIKGLGTITKMPNTAPHVRGVTNLRGAVVPVLDLRARFGLAERESDKLSVIIIVSVGSSLVGLVVDAVQDVLDLPASAIEPPPDLTTSRGCGSVRGIARSADRLIVLLDIDRVVGADVALATPPESP